MFWKFRLFSLFLCVLGDPINQNFIAILLIKILVFVKMKNIFYLKHLQHLQQRLLQWHWVTGVRWRCYMCVCIHIDSWMILFTCYMCVCITWTQTLGWSFLHVKCVSVLHGLKHLDDPFYMLHVCLYHLDSNIWMIPFTCYMCVCITWTQTIGWSFLHITCVSVSHGLKHLDDPFYMLHVCLYHMDSDIWMILFTCYMCVYITWTQTLGWSFLHVTCVSVSLKLKHLDDPSITCVSVSNLFTNIWMILLTGYCVVCLYNINITCYMCFCIP